MSVSTNALNTRMNDFAKIFVLLGARHRLRKRVITGRMYLIRKGVWEPLAFCLYHYSDT